MDIDAARSELSHALGASPQRERRLHAARTVLIRHGADALGITPDPQMSLDDLLELAIAAPPTDERRAFAVLLVYALGMEGLLPVRGEAERRIHGFLERALLNPLRRAGYPFDGSAYDKRQALAGLHATIQQHLLPPEPSIPLWLHGGGRRARD